MDKIIQVVQITEIANMLSKEYNQIEYAEVNDYNDVIFNFRIGKDVWDITLYEDYTIYILKNLGNYPMENSVYALAKDLLTPIRYQVYELHKEKKLKSDKEDDFDYSEELIIEGLDDENDDSFCYIFN